MADSLYDLNPSNGSTLFFTESFRAVLEQNLDYIKLNSANSDGLLNYAELTDAEAVACEGDFRKVAASLGIQQHLVWITMRMNGLVRNEDYTRSLKQIVIPDTDTIFKILQSVQTTQKNI